MLARIARDLYWLGRHLVRAEHTARMLDGLFHADLQGRPDDPASVTLSWDALLMIMGAEPNADGPARRGDVVRLLTTAGENPVSIVSSTVAAREGARTLRDTISAEMWESVNTFDLLLARHETRRSTTAVRDGRDGPVTCAACGCRLTAEGEAFFHFNPLGGRDARGCRISCADAAHDVTGRPIAIAV